MIISPAFLIVALIATTAGVVAASEHTCLGVPECIGLDLCNRMDPPMCGLSCSHNKKHCTDFFGDNIVECESEPINKCGSDSYCSFGCVCSDEETGTCIEEDCINAQARHCPSSLADGKCNKDGSACPSSFHCRLSHGKFSSRCVASSSQTSRTASWHSTPFHHDWKGWKHWGLLIIVVPCLVLGLVKANKNRRYDAIA